MSWKRHLLPTLNEQPRREVVTRFPEGERIPKIIHQIYLSGKAFPELPASLAENVDRLRALNPAWTHHLYDEKDAQTFIGANYPEEVLTRYNQIDPSYGAARADLLRYLVMYKLGGVYLDIKSAASRPFDEVVKADDAYLLAQWSSERGQFDGWGQHYDISQPGGEFQQWHIVCAPGHPFLKAVIEYVLRNIELYNPGLHGFGKYGVLRVTGPVAYTAAIHPLLSKCRHRHVEAERDLGLSYSIFREDEHMSLFNSLHYSQLCRPIISIGFAKQFSAPIFSCLRSSWGMIRKIAGQPGKSGLRGA